MTDAAACQCLAALPSCVSTHPAAQGLGSFPLSGSCDAHCRGCVYTGACVDTFSILFSFLTTPAPVLKHGPKGQYRHTRSRARNVPHGAQGSTPQSRTEVPLAVPGEPSPAQRRVVTQGWEECGAPRSRHPPIVASPKPARLASSVTSPKWLHPPPMSPQTTRRPSTGSRGRRHPESALSERLMNIP